MLLSSSLTDGTVTSVEWLQVVVAGVATIQVWYVANTQVQPAVKAALAGILAALNFAIGIIPDHAIGRADLLNLVIAALTAAGVWGVANRGSTRRRITSTQGEPAV
jgi:hypothetical protein